MPPRFTRDLDVAVRALSAGEIVIYPTETFYGLGVDATSPEALQRLLSLKNRPPFKPFPILLPSVESLTEFVDPIPPSVRRLTEKYWPGPLTIVLPAEGLPKELRNRSGGIGFRVSAHPLAHELVRKFGRCITTTSANPSGRRSARTASEVVSYFRDLDLCILDGGPTPGGQASTVIEFSAGDLPVLHREGPVPWAEIRKLCRKNQRKDVPK